MMKCLCGTSKCKGWLGIKQAKNYDDSLNCHICKNQEELSRLKQVNCEGCSRQFHLNCVEPSYLLGDDLKKCQFCRIENAN